jgi:hypothetical protein
MVLSVHSARASAAETGFAVGVDGFGVGVDFSIGAGCFCGSPIGELAARASRGRLDGEASRSAPRFWSLSWSWLLPDPDPDDASAGGCCRGVIVIFRVVGVCVGVEEAAAAAASAGEAGESGEAVGLGDVAAAAVLCGVAEEEEAAPLPEDDDCPPPSLARRRARIWTGC